MVRDLEATMPPNHERKSLILYLFYVIWRHIGLQITKVTLRFEESQKWQ